MDPLPVHHTCKGIQPIGNNWVGLGIMPGWIPIFWIKLNPVVMSSFSARMALSTSSWHTQLRPRGHIFRNLNLGTCIAKWCLWKIFTNSKLPTNGFVHCTRLASSYLDGISKQHLWWLSCYLAAAKEDRRSAILSTADTALLSKQRGVLPNRPKTSHHESTDWQGLWHSNFHHSFCGRHVTL